MLDQLRRHASSWLVKIVLSLIIFSFILFFGYSRIASRYRDERHYVAIVDDIGIPRRKFDAAYEESLKRMKEDFKGEMPGKIEDFLRQNVLNQMISRELVVRYADRMGITVADEEVAAAIRSDKNLSSNGVFDPSAYEERFLPYYRQRYGEEFEDVVRRDLAIQKMQSFLSVLFGPWQEELNKDSKSSLSPEELFSPWMEDFRKEIKVELLDRS